MLSFKVLPKARLTMPVGFAKWHFGNVERLAWRECFW